MRFIAIVIGAVIIGGCLDHDNRPLTAKQEQAIESRICRHDAGDCFLPAYALNVEGAPVIVDPVSMDPGAGKYVPCGACHGSQGDGGVGPALRDRTVEYITDRLVTYRSGGRVGGQSNLMWAQAATLTDEDINQLANYISNF